MAELSTAFHERSDQLKSETLESHRGLASLMEELEAIDWYNQRIDATDDLHLREILIHNRDEEKEHAMMLLEWLRRCDPVLDKQMRTYLFTECDLFVNEEQDNQDMPDTSRPESGPLDIGDLKGSVR